MKQLNKAFTLIELLIVVAIIAILAAIAVPNFLEAQTRAKVSRAKADIRTIATALESYRVDNNRYPHDCYDTGGTVQPNPPDCVGVANAPHYINSLITTPIAYLTTASLTDPFRSTASIPYLRYWNYQHVYSDVLNNDTAYAQYAGRLGEWVMASAGPDQRASPVGQFAPGKQYSDGVAIPWSILIRYDPTNGTISEGDIIRTQKFPDTPAY